MEIRNPAYNQYGTIDCEISLDGDSWMPFTASTDDVEGHGRDIHAVALTMAVLPYAHQEPPPPTKDQLLAHLAAHRWAVETGGIQLNGMTVATDDRSKTMIMGARIAAMADPNHIANWKMPDGSWAPLDAETITAISNAVLNHVNICFEREAGVAALIEAGDITGLEGVEAAFDA